MGERLNYKNILGVTVWEMCDYCKGKRRVPGGKYRSQGEVINCPVCDGRGMTSLVIGMAEFHTLLTMTSKRVTTRKWKAEQIPNNRQRPRKTTKNQ